MTDNPLTEIHPQSATPVHEQINANTARNVHRHSRFVGILRWALPGFCLLIVGIFLYSSGIFSSYFVAKPKEAQPVVAENSVEMVQPRMSGLDKEERAYEITAEKAKQDVDDPTKVALENIVGSLALNKNDDKVSLTAKSGFFDSEKNFLQLRQDIVISSKQGYTAYLTSADTLLKKKHITSNEPVLIEWREGSIRANSLEIKDEGSVIRFFKGVKVNLRPKSEKKDLN